MDAVQAALDAADFERLQAEGRAIPLAQASTLAKADGDGSNTPLT